MIEDVYSTLSGRTDAGFETRPYWNRCYPRIYEGVGGFSSPKYLSYDLASIFWDYDILLSHPPGTQISGYPDTRITITAACHAARLTSFAVPTFFVERDLLAALWKTTPPEAIDWRTLHLPFESAGFVLPKGFINMPENGDVDFLWYSRAFKDTTMNAPLQTSHQMQMGDDQFYIRTVLRDITDKPAIMQLYTSQEPVIDLSQSLAFDEVPGSSTMTQSERHLGQTMAGLVMNLLLAINARPELMSHGKSKGKKAKSGSEFWHPNIIGRNYRLPQATGRGEVSGITPRMHWRRGHWRNQAFGNQRLNHKQLWIEPTLVAAD